DGDDVLRVVAAQPVDERGEGGGFSGAGGSGDEAQAGALENGLAERAGGIWVDAEGLEFRDVIVENAAGDAEAGRAEMGLDPESAGGFPGLAHRDSVTGKVRHFRLCKLSDAGA